MLAFQQQVEFSEINRSKPLDCCCEGWCDLDECKDGITASISDKELVTSTISGSTTLAQSTISGSTEGTTTSLIHSLTVNEETSMIRLNSEKQIFFL